MLEGSPPIITSNDTVYKFKLGSRLNQIRCEATGFPVPEILFKRNENVMGLLTHSFYNFYMKNSPFYDTDISIYVIK